jgi:tripartite-type tricarboxylate transporter receptor subunit TctC
MLRFLSIAALAGLGLQFSFPATAQDYPSRTIRVFTTSSAGGISDIFMRAVGDELSKRWGQSVVIENRPGGAQNNGTKACSDAPPDGYTICIINADPLVYNQFLIKSMPFNPENAVQPVTNLFSIIQTLGVNSDLGAKTVDELIAVSKAKPKTLSYLTASMPLAIYMDYLVKEKGADWVRVPFKGGGEAINAVLSGSTPIALVGEANMMASIRAGKITPLAMAANIKSPHFPNVPTLEETGYEGEPSRSWYGLFVPPATPRPIVDKLNKEMHAILNEPAFKERLLTQRSLVPALNTPDQFDAEIKRHRVAAEKLMKGAGIEPR